MSVKKTTRDAIVCLTDLLACKYLAEPAGRINQPTSVRVDANTGRAVQRIFVRMHLALSGCQVDEIYGYGLHDNAMLSRVVGCLLAPLNLIVMPLESIKYEYYNCCTRN